MYKDLQAGFALQIPAGWSLTHSFADVRLLLSPEADDISVRTSIIWDQRLDQKPVTLEEYAEFRAQRFGHFAKQRTLLKQQRLALNAEQADSMRFDYQYHITPDQEVRTRSWLLVSGRGQYALSFTAPPEKFERYQKALQQLESSFRLLPETQSVTPLKDGRRLVLLVGRA